MKIGSIIFLAAVVALGAVTLLMRGADVEGPSNSGTDSSRSASRDSVDAFWKIYRTASKLRRDGNLSDAAVAYNRALQMNPRHEDALYYLGNMYLEAGDLESAASTWRRLAEVNPHSSRAQTRLGDLYFCYPQSPLHDLEGARKAYGRALDINQEETGPILRLGLLGLATGDLSTARNHLVAVVASNFKSIPGQFFLGYAAWKSGESGRAAEFYNAAAALMQPEDTSAVIVKGEGDTRGGSRPLISEELGCRSLEPFLQNLTPGNAEIEARYRQVDSFFASLRTR